MGRCSGLLLALCSGGLWLLVVSGAAANDTPAPGMLIDADSGAVLRQIDSDQPWRPASLTKLMTLYLTFEALEQGRLTLDQRLEVSRHAATQPAVRLGLKTGQSISVRQAILALVTVSANDAAVVLAEGIAGSETAFVRQMNDQARRLGLRDTIFGNASGLPDPVQVTTARDMAILALQLLSDFPDRYRFFSIDSFRFDGVIHRTHNPLLNGYTGADGFKTGFTCAAGYNIVASAERDGRRLIAVVLGAASPAVRLRRVRDLLDSGFASAKPVGEFGRVSRHPRSVPSVGVPVRLNCADRRVASIWPIRSWGVLLGVYPDRARGRQAIARARARLRGALPVGQALLLEREMSKGSSWKALLIGYRRDNVGKVCLRLRAHQIGCVAQPPVVLNLPGYARR